MYPASFEYHRPDSVEEAVRLLSELGDGARLLAGGHSLLPVMKLRFAEPGHLVDIGSVEGLSGIREEEGEIVIGSMTTHRAVETSALVADELPILAEAAALIGDPMVRNRGTVGGSLAHADPAADLPAVMLAVDASMTVVGPEGGRSLSADEFFRGMFTTALAGNEVLTEVRIPAARAGSGGAYEKFPHPASRYALDAASARASDGLTAQDDLQGSAEYKLNLVRVMAGRVMEWAAERAR